MRSLHHALAPVIALLLAVCATTSSAQISNWSAFNDFWVNVPATGGSGDYNQSTWIANAGTVPFDTGFTNSNIWSYAGGNFNGGGFASSVGTFVSGAGLYSLTSGGTYAGPGASYNLGEGNFWIGYNDQYGTVNTNLPNALTQIGKYTKEWFGGSPNYTANTGGTNSKYLWVQGTGLSSSTDGLGAMVTWTAPTTGYYVFSGSYVNGNYGQSSSFAIVDNTTNSAPLARQVLSPSSSVNTYNFGRIYTAGQTVQFQVGTPAAAQGSPIGLEANVSLVDWNAARDFYLKPTAAGWTGATNPSISGAAFGYYAANVNGFGLPTQIGSFFTPTSAGSGSQNLYQYSSEAPIGAGTVVGAPGWAATGGTGFAYYADTFSWGSSLGTYQTPWFGGAPGLSQGLTNLIWMQPAYLSNSNAPDGPAEGIAPVLTWKAPATGYYTLSGQFVSGNQPGNGASVAIVAGLNNTQSALELARTVLSNNSSQFFDFTRFYDAGTVVQFQAGSSFTTGNAVGLQLNITAVPEPSTVIAAIGLLGLMCWPALRHLRRKTEKTNAC